MAKVTVTRVAKIFSLGRLLLLPVLLLTVPSSAHAHLVSTRFGEFYSGLLHPLTTLVHIVAWLALACFAVLQGKAFARKILPVFPIAVGLGVLVGVSFGSKWQINDFILLINIASFVVIGGLVVWSRPVNVAAGLLLAVVFGLCHGYANGDVDLANGSLTLYLAGVMTAAYLVVALVAGGAAVINDQDLWGKVALRAFGSWILAAGIIYGGFETLGLPSV